MPNYKCPKCDRIVTFESTIGRGRSQTCTRCGKGSITRSNVYYGNFDPHKVSDRSRLIKKPPRPKVVRITGRSTSAPLFGEADKLLLNPPSYTTYVSSMSDPAWNLHANGTLRIRLAYNNLVSTTTGMQGIIYTPTGVPWSQDLQRHFNAITNTMVANHKTTDTTEGTGEAAAALCIAKNYGGYSMLWGFHLHKGAGIDQIWYKPGSGGVPADYLIVEAKGPDQVLGYDKFQPPSVGSQMSREWVIDRLARMSDPIGKQVLTDLGITTYPKWPNYKGASKSYYGVKTHDPSKQVATMRGVVVTATWLPGPVLSYIISNRQNYY